MTTNPILSVDPILAGGGVRAALEGLRVPRVAVSPLVWGKAVKGPLSNLLEEFGTGSDNLTIARYYGPLVACFVIDRNDANDAERLRALGLSVTATETLMRDATIERVLRARRWPPPDWTID